MGLCTWKLGVEALSEFPTSREAGTPTQAQARSVKYKLFCQEIRISREGL